MMATSRLVIWVITSCLASKVASDCNCQVGCRKNPLKICRKCKVGWYGPYCQKKNVALNGTATQQGTLRFKGRLYQANLAVDGNTNTDLSQGSCSHTDSRNNSWWSVQLGDNGVNQIKYMKIFNREEDLTNRWRRNGMEILIDAKRCKKWPDSIGPATIEDVTCYETLTGHNLTITVVGHYYSVCEVQVFVCSNGWFGEDCDQQCNCLYSNETCDKVTGRCRLGCGAGYMGDDCQTPCRDGRYGPDCSEECGHCVSGQACNTTNGHCPGGCVGGWNGRKCEVCNDGRYGPDCSSVCGHCANNQPCNKTAGHCGAGCEAGWEQERCDVCTEGSYGPDCSDKCGHCANNQPCNKTTGHCGAGCEAGWEQEKCDRECRSGLYGYGCKLSCSDRKCQASSSECNHVTGLCDVGCQAGYTGMTCTHLCPAKSPVLPVVVAAVGIHLCLLRQGRLQWGRQSTKRPGQASHGNVEMNNIDRQPSLDEPAYIHAQASDHVQRSDFAVLDAELLAGDNDYDVIKSNVYQNKRSPCHRKE